MVCQKCTTLQGINNITIVSIDYPQVPVANGELFPITITLYNGISLGTYSLCIYINDVLGPTETITFPGLFTYITKTYQIKMGSSDAHINISFIDEGLVYSNCDNFQDIVVYYKAAVAPRQSCISGVCTPVVNGTFADISECTKSGCKAPVAGGGGISAWFTKKTCITPTTCIPNWGLVGAGVMFYMMMSKR